MLLYKKTADRGDLKAISNYGVVWQKDIVEKSTSGKKCHDIKKQPIVYILMQSTIMEMVFQKDILEKQTSEKQCHGIRNNRSWTS
jgi:hypothetical protein